MSVEVSFGIGGGGGGHVLCFDHFIVLCANRTDNGILDTAGQQTVKDEAQNTKLGESNFPVRDRPPSMKHSKL